MPTFDCAVLWRGLAEVPSAAAPVPGGAATPGRAAAAFRALRHRNFRLFFGGQIISLVGTWMQTVAQAWLIYRLTGSSVLLGVLGFVGQAPIFLLSPIAGLAADRWPRRRVVIATQSVSMLLAFILAALTLTGHISAQRLRESEWEIISLGTTIDKVPVTDAMKDKKVEVGVYVEGYLFVPDDKAKEPFFTREFKLASIKLLD